MLDKKLSVLGVHGIGNFQAGLSHEDAAKRVGAWWHKYLGLEERATLELYYYSDHLRGSIEQGAESAALESVIASDVESWARLLGMTGSVIEGQVLAPVRAIVSWVATKYGLDQRIARRFVYGFFGEVHRYFHDLDARDKIRQEFCVSLESVRPRVVVAHSLGSVVAYEGLWALDASVDVDVFITIGSPLAMPDVVYDRLERVSPRHGRPPCVRRWVNVWDPGDLIAIPREGIARRFSNLDADLGDIIHVFDFHRVKYYLKCGAVQGLLSAYS